MTTGSVTRTGAALVVVLAVGGCSGPPGPSQDEVTAWMDAQDDTEVDGLLGSAAGRVDPGDPEPSDTATGEITLSFPAAARLDGVRLSCLGDGVLDFDVFVTTAAGDGATRTEVVAFPDVPCGTDARDEQITASDVVSVGVTGSGAERAGAWRALVLGSAPA
ncbi:MAG: hypothetical protein ABW025_13335 [Cellulomonas sp.]